MLILLWSYHVVPELGPALRLLLPMAQPGPSEAVGSLQPPASFLAASLASPLPHLAQRLVFATPPARFASCVSDLRQPRAAEFDMNLHALLGQLRENCCSFSGQHLMAPQPPTNCPLAAANLQFL